MSKTKSVGCYGGPPPDRADPRREIWVYDAALSVLLAQTIRAVEQMPPGRRPAWWANCIHDLRVHSIISDFFFDVALGLDAEQREEFARLLLDAAEHLWQRRVLTAQEAANWRVLDNETVIFRGDQPQDTEPIAELGRALAELLRGTLPEPPPGTLWFYGAPGGRSTITMSQPAGEDAGTEPSSSEQGRSSSPR
jgi:hypothetical protein